MSEYNLGLTITFEYSQVDVQTYEDLWTKVDQELGPGILPPLDCSFRHKPPLPQRTNNIEMLFANRHATCINYIEMLQLRMNANSVSATMDHPPTDCIIALLIEHNLFPRPTSPFQGRCLTLLQDGRLALVPKSTLPGDIVVCLAGSTIPYVLRPSIVQEDGRQDTLRGVFNTSQQRPGSLNDPLDCRRCQYLRVIAVATLVWSFLTK